MSYAINRNLISIKEAGIKLSATVAKGMGKSDKPTSSKTLDKFSYWIEKDFSP